RAGQYPVIRFNAFEVERWPSVARLVPCAVAGWRQLREAVKTTNAEVVVALRGGVVGFGRDEEMRRALGAFEPGAFALHPIETGRLEYDSAELGLLYDAVVRALVRGRPLARRRRRGSHFVIAAPNGDAPALVKVKAIAGQLTGTVTGTTVAWAEAVEVSLTFRLGQLWLLIEPRVWTDPPPDRAA